MKPYGGGRKCPCCRDGIYGDNGVTRTAERMEAARDAAAELAYHNHHKEIDAWTARCESVSLIELGHLVFTSRGERQQIAQDIAMRRLRDEVGIEP